jgi:glucose-1-phosphate adenylyltransferase
MEMLLPESPIGLREWRIRTNWDEHRVGDRPPARFEPSAQVEASIVAHGSRIAGTVRHSVLSPGVVVEQGAIVERSILMHDARVRADAQVREAILDKQVEVGAGAIVGGEGPSLPNHRFPHHLDGGQVVIGKSACVPGGAVIERNAILFPYVTLPRGAHSHVRAGQTIGDID